MLEELEDRDEERTLSRSLLRESSLDEYDEDLVDDDDDVDHEDDDDDEVVRFDGVDVAS